MMKLDFHRLAILIALVCFALALVWLFAPGLLLLDWGAGLSSSAALVGRRGAALYAGIGIMFFAARNAQPSPTRSALLNGFAATCMTLAALGVFELATGHASTGILSAVFVEVVLTLALLYVRATTPQPRSEQQS